MGTRGRSKRGENLTGEEDGVEKIFRMKMVHWVDMHDSKASYNLVQSPGSLSSLEELV
jgi:hypothetical protein